MNNPKEPNGVKKTMQSIIELLNFFHHPFRNVLPSDSFRYLVCGGSNALLDAFLFFISYNFIFKKELVDLKLIAISPHIAAFLVVFPVTFTMSFLLTKFIVFHNSSLKWRTQLFRFVLTVMNSFILHYLLLKFFVEVLSFYPTPSKLLTSFCAAVVSYLILRYYTYKTSSITLFRRTNK